MALLRSTISIGKRSTTNPNIISTTSRLYSYKLRTSLLPRSSPAHYNPPLGFRYSIRAIQGTTVNSVTVKDGEGKEKNSHNWKVKMLFDGDCPLCMREVNMLRERNKEYGTIEFVDISSDDYSPQDNQGLDYKTVMGRIHAVLSDGTVVTDVEAFRKLYEAVGLGWVYAITKYEPIATIADAVYGFWAKYRLQITGRPPIEDIIVSRTKKGQVCDDSNRCKM